MTPRTGIASPGYPSGSARSASTDATSLSAPSGNWTLKLTSHIICPLHKPRLTERNEAVKTKPEADVNSTTLRTIGAARFKEQCLQLLDRLGPDGLVITKRGRPVARVLPYERDSPGLIGSLRDKIEVKGDIISTGIRWDAEC